MSAASGLPLGRDRRAKNERPQPGTPAPSTWETSQRGRVKFPAH